MPEAVLAVEQRRQRGGLPLLQLAVPCTAVSAAGAAGREEVWVLLPGLSRQIIQRYLWRLLGTACCCRFLCRCRLERRKLQLQRVCKLQRLPAQQGQTLLGRRSRRKGKAAAAAAAAAEMLGQRSPLGQRLRSSRGRWQGGAGECSTPLEREKPGQEAG